jgi:hypothetical protein
MNTVPARQNSFNRSTIGNSGCLCFKVERWSAKVSKISLLSTFQRLGEIRTYLHYPRLECTYISVGIPTCTNAQQIMAGLAQNLASNSRVSLISGEVFDSVIKAHNKMENSKATAQINRSDFLNELCLLAAFGQYGEIRGLLFSKSDCKVTFYERFSLETLLHQYKTSGTLSARRYHGSNTKQTLPRSKSSETTKHGTPAPISHTMFKSRELHLENSLHIQKSRSNELSTKIMIRSRSAKHEHEFKADAGLSLRRLVSELLFIEIGKKEQLPYHFSPEVSEKSLPCKAAHSNLSADDESDGYTVLPTKVKTTNTVEIIPAFVECEEHFDNSLKAKSAMLQFKTQCNSEEGLSFDQLQGRRIANILLVDSPTIFGTQQSTSDEGLPKHNIVQVERCTRLVPVTVVADASNSHMHFFMYPSH